MIRRSLVALAASVAIAACSNSTPLTGPGQACTSYVQSGTLPEPNNPSDGLDVDVAPWCLPFSGSDVDGGAVTCSLFVTLNTTGDESACVSAGLVTPDSDDLAQLRATADSGAATHPTCMVPQLVGADLDANGSCQTSQKIGWCLMPSTACPTVVGFSSTAPVVGAFVTLGCALCGG